MYLNNLFPELISSSRLVGLTGPICSKEKDVEVNDFIVTCATIRAMKQRV